MTDRIRRTLPRGSGKNPKSYSMSVKPKKKIAKKNHKVKVKAKQEPLRLACHQGFKALCLGDVSARRTSSSLQRSFIPWAPRPSTKPFLGQGASCGGSSRALARTRSMTSFGNGGGPQPHSSVALGVRKAHRAQPRVSKLIQTI